VGSLVSWSVVSRIPFRPVNTPIISENGRDR
jgi:hypothetical protein